MTGKSAKDKDFALNETISLVKRAHRISNTTFVVIEESLVKKLGIDGNDTWFEQEVKHGCILLKPKRISN